jgi:hypothetical protein
MRPGLQICKLILVMLLAAGTTQAAEVSTDSPRVPRQERFITEPARLSPAPARPPGRAGLMHKLNQIVIETYEVPNATRLGDVIKDLHRLARDRSVDQSGVNFILSPALQNAALVGQQFATNRAAAPTAVKLEDYEVTLTPAIKNLPLRALLGAIMEVAVPPKGSQGAPGLRFSVEEYAVVIGQRPAETEPLFTRTFHLDPNTFLQGLDLLTQTNRPSTILPRPDPTAVQLAVRDFFARAGVNFGPVPPVPPVPAAPGAPPPPQKAIFFNDRTGVLFVRTTRLELDLIERALTNVK